MMEKLLHERLREHDDTNTGSWYHTIRLFDNWELKLSKHGANSLADEIERYYIPRPRFEDGEPVQFGDCFMRSNGNQDVVSSIHFSETYAYINSKGSSGRVRKEDFVKRPAPKVCDADGVEIKVGDYGYGLIEVFDDRDDMLKVERINANAIEVSRANGGAKPVWIDSSEFTHERPVFDAECVRICKGDKGWYLPNGKEVEVLDTRLGNVHALDDEGLPYSVAPKDFTHREPDSLESIAKYAKDESVKYAGCIEPLNKVADRLTAFIERGA